MRYALNKEQFTGNYWIDGKKIYQYTMSITFTNVNLDVSLPSLNIDTFLKIDGYYKSPSNEYNPLPYPALAQDYTIGGWLYYKSTNRIRFENGKNRSGGEAYITFYYTKTGEWYG